MTVQTRISRLTVTELDGAFSQEDVLSLLGLDGDAFAEGIFDRSAVSTRSLDLLPATLEHTLQGRTA